MAPCNATQQWHPAMAPRPLPQSWPSPSPRHSTLQWHSAMAPRPLPKSWPSPSPNHSLQWHPAMAPSNGTTSGTAMAPRPVHPAMAPLVQSAKVVRRPPPLLEVRTPIAIAIWGKSVILGELFEVALSQHGTALWRETHLQVKMLRNWRSRSTFWCSNVKLHTVVARSTFASQMFKKLACSEHFLKWQLTNQLTHWLTT